MSNTFRQVDRDTLFFLPPSMDDWLLESHLVRFVVESVGLLDLAVIKSAGRGSKAHHPEMVLALLFYGYATGVFSSSKLEQATYDSVAFRYITANDHPDHDTIASFRKRFLPELHAFFVQIQLIAQQMGCLKLGKASLDGTKIKVNASKPGHCAGNTPTKLKSSSRSKWPNCCARLKRPTTALPGGLDFPAELARRAARLEAKAEIARRAAERYAEEQAKYEKKTGRAQAKEQKNGKKPRGKQPKPPSPASGTKIRSTSLMKSCGSCPSPAAVSINATTSKPASMSNQCSSSVSI